MASLLPSAVSRCCLVTLCLFILTGCSWRNPARIEYCLAALTAVEPGNSALFIEQVGGTENDVTIRYKRSDSLLARNILCRFEGSSLSLGQLDLDTLVLNGEELGPGRLSFLRSHWLPNLGPSAVKDRIKREPEGFFRIDPNYGQYLQSALSALPIASVYVLLALGLTMVSGITGRINIAHGEFATTGAYAGYAGFFAFGAISTGFGLPGAIAFATLAAASAGWMAMRAVFLPLSRNEGLMLLVASVGLILVFEEGIRLSHRSRELWLPPIMSEPMAITVPPYVVTVTMLQIGTALFTLLIVSSLLAGMRLTRMGMIWRAVADDETAASMMGIDPGRVLALSGTLAAVLAGLAGLIILVAYGNANHSMGLMLSIKAMVAALIGGMGSLSGAVAGALLLAAIETCWVVAFGGAYRDAAVFAILIALLTLAPNGLFGIRRH